MTYSSDDRRKFVRVYRNFILTYSSASNPSVPKEVSQITNISQGGMSFSVTSHLQVGEMLNVELRTPFLSEGVFLQGEILGCHEKIPSLIYQIRLEFKNLSTQAKDILLKVEQHAHKEA